MSLPPNIDTIFDINEGIEEVEDMEIGDEDIDLILNIGSSTVILHHYYKHINHHPGSLSDLCTLRLYTIVNMRKR